ncbi:hypothetical protein PR202_ga28027 [Eleusine coracana subsp. coracana]|uniref:Uncharacterized protein n=1 Tax=Eleusine coracana subsp. coracana TaxID=191504 RepID=A0AAV5DJ80_ELECO|nr:hypothetical protein PR202_ga28027 [Eleusine coracana subsp. coracana]
MARFGNSGTADNHHGQSREYTTTHQPPSRPVVYRRIQVRRQRSQHTCGLWPRGKRTKIPDPGTVHVQLYTLVLLVFLPLSRLACPQLDTPLLLLLARLLLLPSPAPPRQGSEREIPHERAARAMAAAPSRSRGDYDHLIKLLLIGDSGACSSPALLILPLLPPPRSRFLTVRPRYSRACSIGSGSRKLPPTDADRGPLLVLFPVRAFLGLVLVHLQGLVARNQYPGSLRRKNLWATHWSSVLVKTEENFVLCAD